MTPSQRLPRFFQTVAAALRIPARFTTRFLPRHNESRTARRAQLGHQVVDADMSIAGPARAVTLTGKPKGSYGRWARLPLYARMGRASDSSRKRSALQRLAAWRVPPRRALADVVVGRPVRWRYGMAIVLTGYAFLLGMLVFPVSNHGPFLFFLAAVTLAAWYGGLGPGLMATLTAFLAIGYLFEQPVGTLAITDTRTAVNAVVFVWVAILISWLHGRLRAAWEDSEVHRREAEASTRIRDNVLAVVSHDLKGPLSALDLWTQLLQRSTRAQEAVDIEELNEQITEMRHTVSGMSSMLDELLDFARIQMGNSITLDRGSVDLVALAREEIAEQARATEDHQFRLDTAYDELNGDWDGQRLLRVLRNLLGNAVKYSPQGGEIVITICAVSAMGPNARTPHTAVLTVEDHGIGIPASERDRVFESMYRASNALHRIQGTGIGLASVKQIVEAHAGDVRVESTEGVGSTFTVCLPLPGSPGDDVGRERLIGVGRDQAA
jgi:signal transduction histidine kinase